MAVPIGKKGVHRALCEVSEALNENGSTLICFGSATIPLGGGGGVSVVKRKERNQCAFEDSVTIF